MSINRLIPILTVCIAIISTTIHSYIKFLYFDFDFFLRSHFIAIVELGLGAISDGLSLELDAGFGTSSLVCTGSLSLASSEFDHLLAIF